MTGKERKTLIDQGIRLYTLGLKLEKERNKLRKLVEKGVAVNSSTVFETVDEFFEYERQWKELETEHLELRQSIAK